MNTFMVVSYYNTAQDAEFFVGFQELSEELTRGAQPDYRDAVLNWANSEHNDVPLEMMNGRTREVWLTAVQ